jgi:hypothetical protein
MQCALMLPQVSIGGYVNAVSGLGGYVDAASGLSSRVRYCCLGSQLAGTLMLPWVSVGGYVNAASGLSWRVR